MTGTPVGCGGEDWLMFGAVDWACRIDPVKSRIASQQHEASTHACRFVGNRSVRLFDDAAIAESPIKTEKFEGFWHKRFY